jgi:hypothetical protein
MIPSGFAGEQSTPYPDLAAQARWSPDWGHLQVAGVVRYLQFDPNDAPRESELGYGLNFTGSIKTWKLDDKHFDSILFQIAGGNGIARYINDTGGLGLDAAIGSPGDDLDGQEALAGFLAYQHWWHRKWASTAVYSYVTINNASGTELTDYHSGHYALVNLRYYPTDRVMLGGEILYGKREDNGGDTGDDVRLQFSAQYKF